MEVFGGEELYLVPAASERPGELVVVRRRVAERVD
jgi:hypothetical protein